MIPKPTRLTKIVRKMMRSGRVTRLLTFYTIKHLWPFASWRPRSCSRPSLSSRNSRPLTRLVPPVDTMRPEILGTHGIVAAGRHYSVSAGVRILQQGGNAVDAGVATVLRGDRSARSRTSASAAKSPTMIYDAKDEGDHRHQRSGSGAQGGDARAVQGSRATSPATARSARRSRRCSTRWRSRSRPRARCGSSR